MTKCNKICSATFKRNLILKVEFQMADRHLTKPKPYVITHIYEALKYFNSNNFSLKYIT